MQKSILPLFLAFLRRQIPRILEVISFLGIIQLLMPNTAVKLILLITTGLLVYWYLHEEGRVYLVEQIKNQFSLINLEHMNDQDVVKQWESHVVLTSLLVTALLGLVTYNLKLL
jgi:hypothetical protein